MLIAYLLKSFQLILTILLIELPQIADFDEHGSTQTFIQHQVCIFNDKPSKWKQCECEELPDEQGYHVRCRRQPWLTIPTILLDEQTANISKKVRKAKMIALSIIESSLVLLSQDVFKWQNLQLLDFTHNNIEIINVNAFRGLENMLYQLILNHNSLSAIPVWSLTYLYQLRYLYLQNNMIVDLKSDMFNETYLNNLQYMHLDYNKITILPTRSLARLPLEVFTISNNRISEIEKLALSPTIWFLDLKNNVLQQIPYLAVRELKSLRMFDLEGNNITEVKPNSEVEFTTDMDLILSNNRIRILGENSFNSFQKFNKLDLSYNQISTIATSAFSSISQMRQIDLSYNKIVHMAAGTLNNVAKSLRRLNLEENQFHTLPIALQALRSLEYLNMNGNKLTKLDNRTINNLKPAISELLLAYNRFIEIPSEALDGMSKLQHLDLSKNRIKNINRLAFGRFDGRGTSLIRLNLAGNHIEKIEDPGAFLYMSSLVYLDLSYNRIVKISENAFERLEGLESLFLQNNLLHSYPKRALSHLRRLRYLLLDNNPISSLPDSVFQDNDQLERTSFSRTLLYSISDRTFPAPSVPNLKSLNFASCRIHHIASRAFYDIPNLQQLLLNDNQLTTINSWAFSSLKNLQQLNLARNHINITMEYSISDMPSLEFLSLSHNRIQYLPKSLLVGVNNLEHLDISHNRLKIFNLNFMEQKLARIKTLDLSHNNIVTFDLNAIKQSLVNLNLAYNNLQSIGNNMINDFNQLQNLDLSNNEIMEIQSNSFTACPKLTKLIITYNHLRILRKGTFAHQEFYSMLNLAHNAIAELDYNTFGDNNVQYLDLSNNELKSIPRHALKSIQSSISTLVLKRNRIRSLDLNDFSGMNNLSELILSDNHIESIEEAAFASMPKLRKLDLSHNPELSHSIEILNLADTGLFSVPKITNRGLRNLNISLNKINELSVKEVSDHKKLAILDLSHNNLKNLDVQLFNRLSEIKCLNISWNRVEEITEKHFENLYYIETLTITNMLVLHTLPQPQAFQHLRHLRNLHLHDLPIIKFYNVSKILHYLPPLRELAIEIKESSLNNQLKDIDLRLLRKITITGKQLRKIETGAFIRLRGYKIELIVRDTSIREFPPAIFNTLTGVSFLSLSLINNLLETFQPFSYTKPPVLNQHGTILHDLQLMGNPIVCDCRLKWLNQWLEYHQGIQQHLTISKNGIKCINTNNQLSNTAFKTVLLNYSQTSLKYCFKTDNNQADHRFHGFNLYFIILTIVTGRF